MPASTAPALPGDAPPYERHRPEQTPLYAVVEEHFPRFLQRLEAEGVSLPHFVGEEFEALAPTTNLTTTTLRNQKALCNRVRVRGRRIPGTTGWHMHGTICS